MTPSSERVPAWTWILAGWLTTSSAIATSALARRPRAASAEAVSLARGSRGDARDPSEMCPRELRTLPGIGQMRALAFARARWTRDPRLGPLSLEDVPGIGPETAQRAREALDDASDAIDGAVDDGGADARVQVHSK